MSIKSSLISISILKSCSAKNVFSHDITSGSDITPFIKHLDAKAGLYIDLIKLNVITSHLISLTHH